MQIRIYSEISHLIKNKYLPLNGPKMKRSTNQAIARGPCRGNGEPEGRPCTHLSQRHGDSSSEGGRAQKRKGYESSYKSRTIVSLSLKTLLQ